MADARQSECQPQWPGSSSSSSDFSIIRFSWTGETRLTMRFPGKRLALAANETGSGLGAELEQRSVTLHAVGDDEVLAFREDDQGLDQGRWLECSTGFGARPACEPCVLVGAEVGRSGCRVGLTLP